MPFEAGGDACGICQSLEGTHARAPAHDNCSCQSTDDDDECEYDYHQAAENTRTGSGDYNVTIHLEIEVYCHGNFVGGISTSFDLSGYSGDGDGDVFDYIEELVASEAASICDCGPLLVV
jgi:hypothetical protein